jgi:hypothetical protein
MPKQTPARRTKAMDPVALHSLYLRVLERLISLIEHSSGTTNVQPITVLSTIPNLVIEPTLLGEINITFFPSGGGLQRGELKPEMTVSQVARLIVFHLTGQ